MAVSPQYADFFNEPTPDIADLLKDISSEVIIGLLAMVQAKLHLGEQELETQSAILRLFIQRQSQTIQQNIRSRILKNLQDKGDDHYAVFSMVYTLDFLHYALSHYVTLPMADDTTPEQELRLFKAYLLFIKRRQQRDSQILAENKDEPVEFFYRNTWPILSGQYEAGHTVNPFTEMIRGIVLFNYLIYVSPYAEQTRAFLAKRGQASAWTYIFALLNVVQQSWEKVAAVDGSTATRFTISATAEFEPMFNAFAMDPKAYAQAYTDNHRNYSGIKDKPLFRFDADSYLVLNWNFFYQKLYEGLLFDLHTYSDIATAAGFTTFPNFKQYVSEVVTEGFLFKKLLTAALSKKYSVLLFDEKTRRGFPDAYYRSGNDVILFEIKDAFFKANAIDTTSYQAVKSAIDEKYNQPNKGTGQLVSQLGQLLTNPFETPIGYKKANNLRVYPVMIYTDHFFSMSGINNYLQDEFDKKVNAAGLRGNFSNIRPLVFMNIRFLINHIDQLLEKGNGLIELFELFYQEQARAEKKVKRQDTGRSNDMAPYFDCFQTFETAVKNRHQNWPYRRNGFVQAVVNILELTQGLPAGEGD